MSRSFRESKFGKCDKPYRGYYAGVLLRGARSLRRSLDRIPAGETEDTMPKFLNRRWMGNFTCRQWHPKDKAFRLIRRNGRKFLLQRKDFVEDEMAWTRYWGYSRK